MNLLRTFSWQFISTPRSNLWAASEFRLYLIDLPIIDSGLNYLEVSIDGFDNEANLKLRGSDENVIIDNY